MPQITEKTASAVGRLRGAAKEVVQGYGGIFRALVEEHGEVSTMMKRVAHSSRDAGVRAELFPKIRKELLSHAEAEERVFYAPLREFDQMRSMIRHAQEEHEQVKSMLEELNDGEYADPAWMDAFKVLMKNVQAHVAEEENEIFPKAKDLLSKERVEQMEEQFVAMKLAELRKLE
jgi:hemerythrin superfamily protein